MDSWIVVVVVAFAVAASVVMLLAWWYARRVKQNLDKAPASVAGARGDLNLAPASIEELRQLSTEPILLAQSPDGVRVQIDQSPMLPMMAFAGKQASGAIAEAAAAITQRYGMQWVVLITAAEDGRVTIRRLA